MYKIKRKNLIKKSIVNIPQNPEGHSCKHDSKDRKNFSIQVVHVLLFVMQFSQGDSHDLQI